MTTNIYYNLESVDVYDTGLILPVLDSTLEGWRIRNFIPDLFGVFKIYDHIEVKMISLRIRSIYFKFCLRSLASIPYLSIRTLPLGDGTDYSPDYHDEQIFKVDNALLNNFCLDESINFYRGETPPDLGKSFRLNLHETFGEHLNNIDIKDIRIITESSQLVDFVLQNAHVEDTQTNLINRDIFFNIENNLAKETTLKKINDKIINETNKGIIKVILGTDGLDTVKAFSTIQPKADDNNRNGIYFQNKILGTKFELYLFGGLDEIINNYEISSLYVKMCVDDITSTGDFPFLHMYTKPKFDGTDAEAWYNSKWTWTIQESERSLVGQGEEIIFYANNSDFNISKPKNENSTNRFIPFNNLILDGDGSVGEILFLSLGSNSGSAVDKVKACVSELGFETGNDKHAKRLIFKSSLPAQIPLLNPEITLINNTSVNAFSQIGEIIDKQAFKNIIIYGNSAGMHNINVYTSFNNVTFNYVDSIIPVEINSTYNYYKKFSNLLRYVKIINNDTVNNYTLYYTIE